MKIAASAVAQESSHLYRQESVKQESLLVWQGEARPEGQAPLSQGRDPLSLSAVARKLAARRAGLAQGPPLTSPGGPSCPEIISEDPQLQTMRLAIEAITGRKIKIGTLRLRESTTVDVANGGAPGGQGAARVGWGVEYDYVESYAEEESLSYAAAGFIRSEDGQEISFSLDLTMSRSFYQSTEIHIRAGDARLVDPLVINFAGQAAALTDASFTFDLEGDGQAEELPYLAAGSAFLVLDHNGDGVVNDGRELFGPTSGHGFSELAAYDDDHNGWIDDNDSVFQELRAWMQDQNGVGELVALHDLGVGALYLDGLEGDFSLTAADNDLLGQIRRTSVFVSENGQVGTIQELDLVV